ncbi:MAG: small subunit ribosomal protein S20 [Oceanicoccus sp.]|jgi:small subunit ribosomal protein S20
MPIIKSAKKRVKQTLKRQARNYNTRSAMRKAIRNVEEAIKASDPKAAESALQVAYKVIDTAAKKKVIPKNTASRRKSKLARNIAGIKVKATPEKAAAKEPVAKKKAPAKKKVAKAE